MAEPHPKLVTPGPYYIRLYDYGSIPNLNKPVLDLPTEHRDDHSGYVQKFQIAGGPQQQWRFEPVGEPLNSYRIINGLGVGNNRAELASLGFFDNILSWFDGWYAWLLDELPGGALTIRLADDPSYVIDWWNDGPDTLPAHIAKYVPGDRYQLWELGGI